MGRCLEALLGGVVGFVVVLVASIVDHMVPVGLAGCDEALAVAGGGAVAAFEAQAVELPTKKPREPSGCGGRRGLASLEHGGKKGLPYVSTLCLQ